MDNMRLDKYLTLTLGISRKDAKDILKNRLVKVNGTIIKDSDYKVKDFDEVTYKDEAIHYEENIYLMMNKPKGYVCSTDDKVNKTVFDLINDYNTKRLMIVGRLDIDTTGLLLITSDGSFVHKLTSPNKSIDKKYYVRCDKPFNDEDVVKFKEGTIIYIEKDEPYKCKSADLEILDDKCEAFITIHEGKFHQVKKMCASVGKGVLDLRRVKVGELELDYSLNEGCYRKLTDEELNIFKDVK